MWDGPGHAPLWAGNARSIVADAQGKINGRL